MILVTGGTGFVGQEVVEELLRLGYRVRLLVRHPARATGFSHDNRVERVQGDVLKPETLPPAMEGLHAVIHLVGIIAETSKVTYEQAHVEATRNLLSAAKQAGVTRWVQMSAAGTRPHAASRYHLTKWAAEELVRQSGLDWTIFRPSLVYGYDERDRLLNLLRRALTPPLEWLQLYSLPLLNGGEPLIQPVSVREVARCFALAPAKEASIGQTFDLVGPVAFTWRKMVVQIMAALGKKGIYEDFPLLLVLRALLWLGVVLFPLALVVAWGMGMLPLAVAEIGAGLSGILLLIAFRWRTTIIYRVPADPLLLASEPLNDFAPRELRVSELLKMAVEDNTGDPRLASDVFGYVPETFDQALARLYGTK